jgi:hypothetical protein
MPCAKEVREAGIGGVGIKTPVNTSLFIIKSELLIAGSVMYG